MIAGIGTDITEVKRFEKWVKNPEMIERFFNEKERSSAKSDSAKCQHYAVRFAAKEAMYKALSPFIKDEYNYTDYEIIKDETGKPIAKFNGNLAKIKQIKEHESQWKRQWKRSWHCVMPEDSSTPVPRSTAVWPTHGTTAIWASSSRTMSRRHGGRNLCRRAPRT